jgi:hypothetical protein
MLTTLVTLKGLAAIVCTTIYALSLVREQSWAHHSALANRTPAEFANACSGGKDGDKAALENAARFPLSLRTAAAVFSLKSDPSSSLLLEAVT